MAVVLCRVVRVSSLVVGVMVSVVVLLNDDRRGVDVILTGLVSVDVLRVARRLVLDSRVGGVV